MACTLRLLEDHLVETSRHWVPACPRVLYVLAGDVVVTSDSARVQVGSGSAWHGSGACEVASGAHGATVLRYELLAGAPETGPDGHGVTSRLVLAHPISLAPDEAYIMRCDRVEFAPGGEARPHGHRGGGIRYLVAGELEVRVTGQPARVVKPGEAWFESGVEPVHAIASATVSTAFIRVSILPRAIRGRPSIVYVDPADAAVKPRTYTVFVDEPIEVPR